MRRLELLAVLTVLLVLSACGRGEVDMFGSTQASPARAAALP